MRHWPLWGEFTGDGKFPAQRARNAENPSIWFLHHVRLVLFFQVLDPNDITGNISSPQVLNETHSITSTGMVSRLVLNVSVVEPKIYQCQFNRRDGQKCRENIAVIFRGMLNLSIQEIISLNDVISYFCMIDWRNYFLRSMTCNVAGIYWPNMVCSLRFAKLSITS